MRLPLNREEPHEREHHGRDRYFTDCCSRLYCARKAKVSGVVLPMEYNISKGVPGRFGWVSSSWLHGKNADPRLIQSNMSDRVANEMVRCYAICKQDRAPNIRE